MDDSTKSRLKAIPLCKTKAGPRDGDLWIERLKEEYQSIIKFVQNNKETDSDWFRLESNADGTKWFGKCWHYHNMIKYEFDVEFDIPITYPVTAPEIALPELDGKTAKMYRGGKICLSDHFKPLWARNLMHKNRSSAMFPVVNNGFVSLSMLILRAPHMAYQNQLLPCWHDGSVEY
ncbi:Ubiquitin-fold modifier-conjugating enzyme 1 [Trichostrongylus colubriformis]|uniref:Ubiquitin-fold modifier-conjugating enzyme 1 n=1 Tax=Trichostrongylus colubriformis TaxID=6319 RepID=A0AAN8FV53_TRICO